MRVSGALEKAADLIERTGHAKSADEVLLGRHCIVSALTTVAAEQYFPARELLAERLGTEGLVSWSDRATEDEVIELFRKTAAEARWSEVDA